MSFFKDNDYGEDRLSLGRIEVLLFIILPFVTTYGFRRHEGSNKEKTTKRENMITGAYEECRRKLWISLQQCSDGNGGERVQYTGRPLLYKGNNSYVTVDLVSPDGDVVTSNN